MDKKKISKFFESRTFQEFYFFAIALILAFGTLQTAGTVLDTSKPVVTVVSCSMYPQYNAGDVLFVQGQDFSDLEKGDIVVYEVPARLDISVEGEDYSLTAEGKKSVSTAAGTVELLGVRINPSDRSDDIAVVEVNGERKTLEEGVTKTVNGATVDVQYVTKMNIPIVHRVVSLSQNSLETRGDNNRGQLEFESDVKPSQVHGTVLFSVPRIGLVKLLTMDFLGFSGDQPFVLDQVPRCTDRTGSSTWRKL